MTKLTKEQREKLAAVAKDLMAIWQSLPIPDSEEGYDYAYRGGLVQLTVKGGLTDGWVDISWNEIITDIYAGEKLAHITQYTYDQLVKDATKASEEKDQRDRERRKGMSAEEWVKSFEVDDQR